MPSAHRAGRCRPTAGADASGNSRSEEHTSELQSHSDLVCRLLLEKKKPKSIDKDLRRSRKTIPRGTASQNTPSPVDDQPKQGGNCRPQFSKLILTDGCNVLLSSV